MPSLLAKVGQTLARIRNETPVPFAGANVSLLGSSQRGSSDVAGQMRQYGSIGTLFAIVSMEAVAVAKVDWHLYRKAASGKDEDRVEVTAHPALSVLNKPNDFYSRQELFETGQQYVDLAGIAFWVVRRNSSFASMPLELWPVRPDKMTPVTHPTDFLVGWIYTGPSGEKIPLDVKDVLAVRMPDPENPYMGLGPVQSIRTDVEAAHYIAEWNRNFFRNSAEPGGIIQFDSMLDDTEFATLQKRWQEQHKGVSNAHRVAILEKGTWVERKYTQRDMEFSNLRKVSSDVIREAFAFPAFMLGQVTDINRANADASERFFARYHTVTRLDRWKGLLNNDFLPLFGSMGTGYEFDYDSPVSEDEEIENASRTSKTAAAVAMVGAGFDAAEVLEAMELPAIAWNKPEVAAPFAAPPDPAEPDPAEARLTRILAGVIAQLGHDHHREGDRSRGRHVGLSAAHLGRIRNDLNRVQGDWKGRLDALLASWKDVSAAQRAEISEQVEAAVDSNDLEALQHLHVSTHESGQLLAIAMSAMSEDGAMSAVLDARDQGQAIGRGHADEGVLTAAAALTVFLLAQGLTNAAAREALRNYSTTAHGADVADAVDTHLSSLSDAFLRDNLGGALGRAQMAGRLATYKQAPEASLYASEVLDSHICPECERVDGKFLGLSTDMSMVDQSYPNGQYVHCEGGIRCRGQVVAVWRQETTGDGGEGE